MIGDKMKSGGIDNESDFELMLMDIFSLMEDNDEYREELEWGRVDTFESCGILTLNKGLVVRLNNGHEFQITIVQSR